MRNIRETTHENWIHEWALFTILQEAGRTDLDDQMIYKRDWLPEAFKGGPVGNQMIWLVVPANWSLQIRSFLKLFSSHSRYNTKMKQNDIINEMCYTKCLFLDHGYFKNVYCVLWMLWMFSLNNLDLFQFFSQDWLMYTSCKNNTLFKFHPCFTNETSIFKNINYNNSYLDFLCPLLVSEDGLFGSDLIQNFN